MIFVLILCPNPAANSSSWLSGSGISSDFYLLPEDMTFQTHSLSDSLIFPENSYSDTGVSNFQDAVLFMENESVTMVDPLLEEPGKKPFFLVENQDTVFSGIPDEGEHNKDSRIISLPDSDFYGANISALHRSNHDGSGRNDAVGGILRYDFENLTLGAQYLTSVTPYSFTGEQQDQGPDSYGVSLSYKVASPLVIDFRYESFDPKASSDVDTLDRQYGIGATYSFTPWHSGLNFNVSSSFQRTENSISSGSLADGEDLDEFFINFSLNF